MKKESYSSLAINAMHRASKKAVEKAANLDLQIPEWKDGRVVFVPAKEKLKRFTILGL